MKAVDLIIKNEFPPDIRDMIADMDDKSINSALAEVYKRYPDRFRDISHRVATIGREASYRQGETISLKDLVPTVDKDTIFKQMDAEVDMLRKEFKNDPDTFQQKREEVWLRYSDLLQKAVKDSTKANLNNIGMSVFSGARGKPPQIQAMLATPALYQDQDDKTIPVFIRRSFSEGLRPGEYMAGTYGARRSVISTKSCREGTLVRMADGSTKTIENIRKGDWVLGADKEANTFPVQVLALYDNGVRPVYRYFTFASKNFCKNEHEDSPELIHTDSTEDHKYLMLRRDSTGHWKLSVEIKPIKDCDHHFDFIMVDYPSGKVEPCRFLSTLTEYIGEHQTYDIEVDHPDHLFVLANGIITSNSATAKGGDLAKLMSQASSPLIITTGDCKVDNGVAYDIEDPTIRNRVLQRKVGSLPAGTLLDRHAIAQLRKEKVGRVIARSPLTCKADGLCAKCHGYTFENKFPEVGEHVGITAANALCLHGSTKVMMSDFTWKKLRTIEKGDKVLGFNKNGTFSPTEVLDVVCQGKQPIFEFNFKSRTGNAKVQATPNHVFLGAGYNFDTKERIGYQEIEIGSVTRRKAVGSVMGLTKAFGYYEPENPYEEKYAFLLGLLLGDGTIGPSSLRLSCYDPSLTEEVGTMLKEMGISLNGTENGDKGNFILSTFPDENPLRKRLEELGLWGSRTRNKFIPEEVFQTWSHKSVCQFLAGLYAADGYVGARQEVIKFTSSNETLAEGVSELLRNRFLLPGTYLTPFQRAVSWEYDVRVRNRSGMYRLASYLEPYMLGKKKHALKQCLKVHKTFDRDVVYLSKVKPMGMLNAYDLVLDNETHMFLTEGMLISHNSEPITQSSLSSKHTAGQAKGKKAYGGFEILSQFVQSPEEYVHRAMVAPDDGIITEVAEAPQGGHIIKVDNKEIYVPQGYPVLVKQGDQVEAGDQLSEGIVDVRDVVEKKGLGDGRKYYVDRLKEIYADSGMNAHPKNLEVLARGALSTVNLDEEFDDMDYLPDDAVDYNLASSKWKPKDIQDIDVSTNPTGYLAKDTLHHTAGTRVTRALLKDVSKEGFQTIPVTQTKPPFSPRMDRLRVASHSNRDWLASMSTSYLKDQLNEAAVRGFDTNVAENQHWAPRIAVGEGFGENVKQTGKF